MDRLDTLVPQQAVRRNRNIYTSAALARNNPVFMGTGDPANLNVNKKIPPGDKPIIPPDSLYANPARPMFAKDRWNIAPNSKVEVTTNEGYRIRGDCLRNPIHTKTPNQIEIVNCSVLDPMTSATFHKGLQRFFRSDILKLEVSEEVGGPQKTEDIPERLMMTKVVTKYEVFCQVMRMLEKEEMIGISMHGVCVGRGDASIGWICIYLRGLLINIDVLECERSVKDFWRHLDVHVFSNEKLTKVVHNCRPMVDFLFHNKAIETVNIFDTQIGELYLRYHMNVTKMPMKLNAPGVAGSNYNWEMKPLSYSLEVYLKHYVCPSELPLLKEFENMIFLQQSPLMKRPFTDRKLMKCVAISMKYLLPLRQAQVEILMSHMKLCFTTQIDFMKHANMAHSLYHIRGPPTVSDPLFNYLTLGNPVLFDPKVNYETVKEKVEAFSRNTNGVIVDRRFEN